MFGKFCSAVFLVLLLTSLLTAALSIQPAKTFEPLQSSSLVGWWKFDEGSGTIAYDSSGNGNDGTIYGAIWTTGQNGSALQFDGVDDHVAIPDLYASSPSALTVAAWINSPLPGDGSSVIHYMDNGEFVMATSGGPGELVFGVKLTNDKWYDVYSTTTPNVWHFIAATWTMGGNLELYVDGQLVSQTTVPDYYLYSSGYGSVIGASWPYPPTQYFNGLMDNVRVYTTALSADEIEALYGSTVTFTESGLTQGSEWSVTFNGATQDSTSGSIIFNSQLGIYPFSVTPSPASPCSDGFINVTGSITVPLEWVSTGATTYYISINAYGLPKGTFWSATYGHIIANSTSSLHRFSFPSGGDYRFSMSSAGYVTEPSSVVIEVGLHGGQKSATTQVIFIPKGNPCNFVNNWNPLLYSYNQSYTATTWSSGGNCYGFASTALLYFMHSITGGSTYPYYPSQSPQASATWNLTLPSNYETLNNASLAVMIHQQYDPNNDVPKIGVDESRQFVLLQQSLALGVPVVLGMSDASGDNIHSVVAWGIGMLKDQSYAIAVYDPGWPESTQVVSYIPARALFVYGIYSSFVVISPKIIDKSWFASAIYWWCRNWKRLPIYNYYIVIGYVPKPSSKSITVKSSEWPELPADRFTGTGDSRTFVKGIPYSSGIEEGNVQVFGFPSFSAGEPVIDPGLNQSTLLITSVENDSGQPFGYGYLINATTLQGTLNYTVTPSSGGLSINAGGNALNASVSFFSATSQGYSVSQALNVSLAASQTANFPAFYVANVAPSKTVVTQGASDGINVTVANKGNSTETFNLNVYANQTLIGSRTNVSLASNSTTTITLDWDTTSFAYGNYTISASAQPISGETNAVNSAYTDGTVQITAPGGANGLVGYWKFDEGSGTIAYDSSGNGNDGTINGATWTDGEFGKALDFNGVNSSVKVNDSPTLNITGDQFTLSAWVYPRAQIAGGGDILAMRSGLVVQYYISWWSNPTGVGFGTGLYNGYNTWFGANTFHPLNTWYNVVAVYDGTRLRLFVDDQLEIDQPVTGNLQPLNVPLYFGWTWGAFNGKIDEVKIYSRAWSAVEIQAEYERSLSVTILPSSVGMDVDQAQLFSSSVSGGTSPYSYQWYLNGVAGSGANGATWTFTPLSAGSYTVYVKVTDSVGATATSNTASVTANVDWWPMFHHDVTHFGYSTSTAPTTNQTLWSTAIGSWPEDLAVADGRVFVESYGGEIYALNDSSGKIIWGFTTEGVLSGSPAFAGGIVYLGSADYNIYALNEGTGKLIWNYTTGGTVYSSPAVVGGVVYVGSADDNIYALNATTGTLKWKYATGNSVYSSPAVVDGLVFVGSNDFKVYALNASTGALKWSYTAGDWVDSSPAVVNGVVFVGSDDDKLYALNASTGAFKWSYTTGLAVRSSPAVAGGLVFVGSIDNKTYVLNASTGALVWSYVTGGPVYSSPAVAGGIVFVGSEDDKLYALNADTGALVWSYTAGGYVSSSPAVVGGVVFVGSSYPFDDTVYAFGLSVSFSESGLPQGAQWSVTFDGQTRSSTSNSIIFNAVNGVYPFSVTPPFGYVAFPSSGSVTVNGANVAEHIMFIRLIPNRPWIPPSLLGGGYYGGRFGGVAIPF